MYLKSESEHYVFHYTPGSVAEQELREICRCQEACFSKITGLLPVDFPMKIHYWLCESPEEVGRIYGDNEPCNGFAREPDTVYAVYTEDVKCIGPHEDAHLISYRLAKPDSVFLREGLAMFFDETWWGEPNEVWVKRFAKAGKMPPIKRLFSDDFFYQLEDSLTYPIAGAFTSYLIARYGSSAYFHIYRYLGHDWDEAFVRCFGKGIEEAADGFLLQI